MTDRTPVPPSADFLPHRSETLRESFQEKMRLKGGRRNRGDEARVQIRFLSMEHGPHPEVQHLNDRFLPGSEKLKTTLDVLGGEGSSDGIPAAAVPRLLEVFPGLTRHRCCGGNDLHSTLFHRRSRSGCALPPTNHGTDLCHLLEHLAMEMVAAVTGARRCSGLTCGYRTPPNRFDLFLECPDPRVGAVALSCAAQILHSLLTQGYAPAGSPRYAEAARYFLGRPRSVLNPGDVLADMQGDPVQLEDALKFLAVAGFLEEQRFTFDFSGAILFRYRLAAVLPTFPVDLPADIGP